jgi:16S rRNA (adenine1518-N6/adenine1519-N6)-dimethyltransferase
LRRLVSIPVEGLVLTATVRLHTPADIRELAGRLGLRPSKSLGQNFVVDPGTVRKIARLAGGMQTADVALEVGPGLGSLSLGLLEAGWRVTAIEIDPALGSALPTIAAQKAGELAGRLGVIVGDAMDVHALPEPPPTALVANLPYNVSVPVILHVMATFPTIARGLVMVQSEVADRLVAPPGGRVYGVPSAKLAWHAAARCAGTVGRAAFWPVPRVDSALVAFERREPPAAAVAREAVFTVIDAAFSQRRKMLRSALATWAGGTERASAVLEAAGIDPTLRGERIGIESFARIAQAATVVTG